MGLVARRRALRFLTACRYTNVHQRSLLSVKDRKNTMDEKEQPDEGFKIFDRRKFTVTGEARFDVPPEEKTPAAERKEPPPLQPPKTPPPRKDSPRKDPGPISPPRTDPPRDSATQPRSGTAGEPEQAAEFGAFLMSLANTALMYMEAS